MTTGGVCSCFSAAGLCFWYFWAIFPPVFLKLNLHFDTFLKKILNFRSKFRKPEEKNICSISVSLHTSCWSTGRAHISDWLLKRFCWKPFHNSGHVRPSHSCPGDLFLHGLLVSIKLSGGNMEQQHWTAVRLTEVTSWFPPTPLLSHSEQKLLLDRF